MSKKFLSHPDKLYEDHITRMINEEDSLLVKAVKKYHDIAKLKENFQIYIRDTQKGGVDKNHSSLSAYLFLLNNNFEPLEMMFGFLSIVSHHGNVENFFELNKQNKNIGSCCLNSKEFSFFDEVVQHAKEIELYFNINGDLVSLEQKVKTYQTYLRRSKLKKPFVYEDFVAFKKLYASLIYSDKYEAIFSLKKELTKKIDINVLKNFIDTLPPNTKRANFRQYVLDRFDASHSLFTLTAPTGYGKTLTALDFAMQFEKEKIIFALPFTSIIDQTESIISSMYKQSDIDIFKVHHKSMINEELDEDRYSQVKFLMNSFSGEITVTTLYQIIFALFGHRNKDNVKFHQFQNSVVIIDEAQAIPYQFRKDFFKLCEAVSMMMNTVFIFMSATMPVIESNAYKEISNLEYFKEQNRYVLEWLELEEKEKSLIEKIKSELTTKHTLVVVNTIKKAQELYLQFQEEYECYALNGYMTDHDKQKVIERVHTRLEQQDSKIVLVSTQSIEAGVDLDFEVGFREIAPVSSIIQTAGRVNRHFGPNQGVLYVFEDISEYSDLIYGDLNKISVAIIELLKENPIEEKDILDFSTRYFEKIRHQLERHYIQDELCELEFQSIHKKIEGIMDGNDFKELIIVEPSSGFIAEMEQELLEIKQCVHNKYRQKDKREEVVKKLRQYGVNISKKDIDGFQTNIQSIKYLHEICYLPAHAPEYDLRYGVVKPGINKENDLWS